MNYKVSILISVYNGEKDIDNCFSSLANQSFKDFEIICIDDFSSDKSLKKLEYWQNSIGPDRMQIIKNAYNLGLTRSLNIAILHSSCEYLARIDADDTWEKEKLQKQLKFMEKNPDYGIVGCNHINLYKSSGKRKFIKLPQTNEDIRKNLFRRNPFAHSCILAKADLIKKVGGYNEKIYCGQDYDLWLRCLPFCKMYNLQEFLCTRIIDGGISVSKQKKQMWQSIKTRSKYIRKYNYSWKNYIYLLEPLLVIATPNFIKNFKRKYF